MLHQQQGRSQLLGQFAHSPTGFTASPYGAATNPYGRAVAVVTASANTDAYQSYPAIGGGGHDGQYAASAVASATVSTISLPRQTLCGEEAPIWRFATLDDERECYVATHEDDDDAADSAVLAWRRSGSRRPAACHAACTCWWRQKARQHARYAGHAGYTRRNVLFGRDGHASYADASDESDAAERCAVHGGGNSQLERKRKRQTAAPFRNTGDEGEEADDEETGRGGYGDEQDNGCFCGARMPSPPSALLPARIP